MSVPVGCPGCLAAGVLAAPADGTGVTMQIVYVQQQTVLAALGAAHQVCDKAASLIKRNDYTQAWEVLHDRRGCLDAGLRYTGWPSDGFAALQRQMAAAGQTPTAADMVAALRQQLRLTAAVGQAGAGGAAAAAS